jgi:hypothetical protein
MRMQAFEMMPHTDFSTSKEMEGSIMRRLHLLPLPLRRQRCCQHAQHVAVWMGALIAG